MSQPRRALRSDRAGSLRGRARRPSRTSASRPCRAGQGQRVAIARMLARDVDLVIADEPTANLDPGLRNTVMGLLRRLSERVPVIVVTHDASVAESCDRTIILQATVSSVDLTSGRETATVRRRPCWRQLVYRGRTCRCRGDGLSRRERHALAIQPTTSKPTSTLPTGTAATVPPLTPPRSAAVPARLEACEHGHRLAEASEELTGAAASALRAPANLDGFRSFGFDVFASCAWPPPHWPMPMASR